MYVFQTTLQYCQTETGQMFIYISISLFMDLPKAHVEIKMKRFHL